MKEFKKWLEEPTHRTPASYPRYATCDEDAAAREGWQTALKTLKKECHCAGMWGEKGSCELVDWINKELEEN